MSHDKNGSQKPSDTPETDAATYIYSGSYHWRKRSLCRRLERERNEARRALEQESDIRSDLTILLSLVADGLGVKHEPHQTFNERLLEASTKGSAATAVGARTLLAELRDYLCRLKHRADVRGGPDVSAMGIADEAIALIDDALAVTPTVTDLMVEAGARRMAGLVRAGIIEKPPLTEWEPWAGSVRAVLEAALNVAPTKALVPSAAADSTPKPKHLQDAPRTLRNTFKVTDPNDPEGKKRVNVVYASFAVLLEREANALRAQKDAPRCPTCKAITDANGKCPNSWQKTTWMTNSKRP